MSVELGQIRKALTAISSKYCHAAGPAFSDAIDDALEIIDAAIAAAELPPVCTTVEDVVRAAPVSGHYYVSHHGSHTWRIMRLEIEGVRRWFAIDDMSVYRDERFLGQHIGPRIRMPGEG